MPGLARLVAVLLLSATLMPSPAGAQAGGADELDALRRAALARFEVVPLREGVALVGRGPGRRVEIVDGLVLDGGTPLSGAELRSRLGPDAAIVLRLSYLDNAALKALFATPSAVAAAPPVAAPAVPRTAGACSRACSATSAGCRRACALAIPGAAILDLVGPVPPHGRHGWRWARASTSRPTKR